MDLSAAGIDQASPSEVKIALFRSLFRGREDVYARRFESRKTGKSGYAGCLCKRVGARSRREASDQVRRLSQPSIPPGDRRRLSLALVRP
jgi:hypothetical protein